MELARQTLTQSQGQSGLLPLLIGTPAQPGPTRPSSLSLHPPASA